MQPILIIGQAPPAIDQKYPYSTTMLYTWLDACGISIAESQKMFIFDAVYNKFPGFKSGGGHKIPTTAQMEEYWPELEQKIISADKVWLLGNIAADWFDSKDKTWSCNLEVLKTMHPSLYNRKRWMEDQETFINKLKTFIES